MSAIIFLWIGLELRFHWWIPYLVFSHDILLFEVLLFFRMTLQRYYAWIKIKSKLIIYFIEDNCLIIRYLILKILKYLLTMLNYSILFAIVLSGIPYVVFLYKKEAPCFIECFFP